MAYQTDIVSLETAKRHLNIAPSDISKDLNLARTIRAFSNIIDQAYGAVVRRDVDVTYPSTCTSRLMLPIFPVYSIQEVRVDNTPIPSTSYYLPLWPSTSNLYQGTLLANGQTWLGKVQVLYTAGRHALTHEAETSEFGEALLVLLSWIEAQGKASIAQTGEFDFPTSSWPRTLPRAVQNILKAHELPYLA
jgi:hypothetical protein